MPNITGTVLDARSIPLPGVTIILAVPGAAPAVQLTDANGTFNYPAMAAGTYKLTAVHGSFGYAEDKTVVHDGVAVSNAQFAVTAATPPPDDRYRKLKYGQYIFLGVIGLLFFVLLIWTALGKLRLDKNKESEDGKISATFNVPDTVRANTPFRIVIRGKDKNNVAFTTPDDEKHRFKTSQ